MEHTHEPQDHPTSFHFPASPEPSLNLGDPIPYPMALSKAGRHDDTDRLVYDRDMGDRSPGLPGEPVPVSPASTTAQALGNVSRVEMAGSTDVSPAGSSPEEPYRSAQTYSTDSGQALTGTNRGGAGEAEVTHADVQGGMEIGSERVIDSAEPSAESLAAGEELSSAVSELLEKGGYEPEARKGLGSVRWADHWRTVEDGIGPYREKLDVTAFRNTGPLPCKELVMIKKEAEKRSTFSYDLVEDRGVDSIVCWRDTEGTARIGVLPGSGESWEAAREHAKAMQAAKHYGDPPAFVTESVPVPELSRRLQWGYERLIFSFKGPEMANLYELLRTGGREATPSEIVSLRDFLNNSR